MAEFTREEIDAELKRRGAIPEFTQEEINAELIRRGITPPGNTQASTAPDSSWLQNLSDAYQGLGNFAQGIGVGGFQGVANILPTLANIPSDIGEAVTGKHFPHLPYADLSSMRAEGTPAAIGQSIGEGLSMAVPAVPIAGALGKGIQGAKQAAGLAPELGILSRILQGGLTGAMVDSDRKSGAIGGAIGGALTRGVEKAIEAQPQRIAQLFKNKVYQLKDESQKMYNSVFDKAQSRGLEDIALRKPNIDLNEVVKSSPKRFTVSVKAYLNNPTLKNAFKAQSDMGKLEQWFLKKPSLLSQEDDAMRAARQIQKKIRGSLYQHFQKTGNVDLAQDLQTATQHYADEVVPYIKNKTIDKLLNKKMKPENFVKKMLRDDEFMLSKGMNHPELKSYQQYNTLKDLLLKISGGAGLFITGAGAGRMLNAGGDE